MKRFTKTCVLIITFFLISSCDVIEVDNSSIYPLDSKIIFKVVESYDNYDSVSTPQFYVELKTEKEYGCFNYSIPAEIKVEEKSIVIEILGIYKPDVCLAAIGPARTRIKLAQLSGFYEINITNNNFSDKYNLLVTDSLIIIDGKETTDTKPSINFLWRYPENSFVFLCGTTLSDSSLCGSFIDTLQSAVKLREFHFSDFAEIPYPTASQGYYYDANARYFYYESEEEFDKIEDVMRRFKYRYFPNDDGIGLTIINWMNKKIYSRLL